MSEFGKRLKKARKAAGLSQVELAKITGLSKSAICNYESGKRTNPSIPVIKALAAALNTDWRKLAGLPVEEILRGEVSNAEAGTDDVPALEKVSDTALLRMDIPPLAWIVDSILPQGLTILCGAPKVGKSWAALDLCLSVALGRPFLGFATHKAGVLYLALEDGLRRLKTRLESVLDGSAAPGNLHLATAAQAIDTGLAAQMDDFMKKHADTRLIIIDVLARVRSASTARRPDGYRHDYADMAALQTIAQKYGVALVIIHHTRKMVDSADVFNSISGTTGLFGGSDGAWVLQKDQRDDAQAKLYVIGREVEAETFAVAFDKATCRWRMLGTAEAD